MMMVMIIYIYRPMGRPRQRWQEDVMEDLKKAENKKLEGNS